MGDLFLSIFETATWDDQDVLARFRRALRQGDQRVLDSLLEGASFGMPHYTLRAVSLPGEISVEMALVAALLAEQKRLICAWEGMRMLAQPPDGYA